MLDDFMRHLRDRHYANLLAHIMEIIIVVCFGSDFPILSHLVNEHIHNVGYSLALSGFQTRPRNDRIYLMTILLPD